jgi:hypothetical protein
VPEPDHWTLVFEALPDPAPVAVRVRGLLKRALRSYRLKCVAIGGTPPATPTGPAPATSPEEVSQP